MQAAGAILSFLSSFCAPSFQMITIDTLVKWLWVALYSVLIYIIARGLKIYLFLVSQKSRPPFDAKLPCAPNAHWLLGNLGDLMGKGPMGMKALMVDAADKNGISTFWLMNNPTVAFLDPKDAQRVLRSSVSRAGGMSVVVKHFRKFLGSDSIVTIPGGSKWRISRSVVHKAFTPESLSDAQVCINMLAGVFSSTIVRIINDERSTKKISLSDGYLGISPDGNGIILDYSTVFKMVTIDVIGKSAFGYDFECSKTLTSSYYASAFSYLQSEISNRVQKDLLNPFTWFYSIPTRRNLMYKKSARILREFLLKITSERRAHRGGNRTMEKTILLDYLIDASDSTKFTDQMLSDSLLTLLAAGYETSSITLTYAAYLLATNPEVDELCAQEVRATLGEPGSPIPKDLDPNTDLVYCRAVILEALRLFPPVMVLTRALEKPMKLENGVTLPSGTNVSLPIYWIQRDAQNFPNPEKCAPERWATRSANGKWAERFETDQEEILEARAENELLPPAKRDAFLSFSAGARSCVGRRFALQEATVVLAACVRELKFDVVDGYVLDHQRQGITFGPTNGMPLITKKREKSSF
jgi:cytochrome P450